MRSPALAIGWEFRRRHRWGLIAVAGYLFVVATIRFLILGPGEPVLVDSVRFAAVVSVPLTTTFVWCGTNPLDSVVATDVTRLEYTTCADDAAVVLYTIKGGGHTWPGGQPLPEWFVGRTSKSIDASSLMWAFFRAHRLREAQTGAQHK